MLTALSSKPATAVANGLAILTPVFALITWLTPDWFGQLTLPKALLVGLLMAFTFLFVTAILLAIFAWTYRKFRPLDHSTESSDQAVAQKYESEGLNGGENLTAVKEMIQSDFKGSMDELQGNLQSQLRELESSLEVRLRALAECISLAGVADQIDDGLRSAADSLLTLSNFESTPAFTMGEQVNRSKYWGSAQNGITERLAALAQLIKDTTGTEIYPHDSPAYAADPFMRAPNDDKFTDEGLRQDFRRLTDELRTFEVKARAEAGRIRERFRAAEQMVAEMGKKQ